MLQIFCCAVGVHDNECVVELHPSIRRAIAYRLPVMLFSLQNVFQTVKNLSRRPLAATSLGIKINQLDLSKRLYQWHKMDLTLGSDHGKHEIFTVAVKRTLSLLLKPIVVSSMKVKLKFAYFWQYICLYNNVVEKLMSQLMNMHWECQNNFPCNVKHWPT